MSGGSRARGRLSHFQEGYRLLLRAHESNTFDSVLYAIP
jgi:hypothetical protein